MPHLSKAHLELFLSCMYKHIRSLSTDSKQLATLLAKSYHLLAAEIKIIVTVTANNDAAPKHGR